MYTADELCDRVAFIVDGSILTTDSPKTLKHQHGKNIVKVELKDGKYAEFPVEDLGKNHGFIDFLSLSEIQRINTLEATLEEVFIKITGKALKV
jgi:fluoroquinolone transport system ATP-binding protein